LKRVDTIARVRRAFHVQGWSLKKIARELHVSRNTVRKILRTDETDFSCEREHQPMPRIGPWQERLDQILLANANKPSRERLTLTGSSRSCGVSATRADMMPSAAMPAAGRGRAGR
jgi:AraC-like DNA-binding protein